MADIIVAKAKAYDALLIMTKAQRDYNEAENNLVAVTNEYASQD